MLIATIPKDIYAQKSVTFAGSVLPLFSAARKQPTPPPPHPHPPPLTSFLLTLLTNQPSSSYSPLLPLPLLRAHAAAYYRSFPYFSSFFFHPSVCIHRTGTVSHMASQSLFFTAARSSWKASDETWQVSQPNTVESVKHLDASRLTESTLWRVVQIFCRFKKK